MRLQWQPSTGSQQQTKSTRDVYMQQEAPDDNVRRVHSGRCDESNMLLGQAESLLWNIANLGAVWLGTCSVRFPVPGSATLPRQSVSRSVVEARIVA